MYMRKTKKSKEILQKSYLLRFKKVHALSMSLTENKRNLTAPICRDV